MAPQVRGFSSGPLSSVLVVVVHARQLSKPSTVDGLVAVVAVALPVGAGVEVAGACAPLVDVGAATLAPLVGGTAGACVGALGVQAAVSKSAIILVLVNPIANIRLINSRRVIIIYPSLKSLLL